MARHVCFHVKVNVSDVVFCGDQAGKVCNCLRDDSNVFVLVKVLAVVTRLSQHAASYTGSDTLEVWRMDSIEQSRAWRNGADDSIIVIRR